jgi:hypothetical protein
VLQGAESGGAGTGLVQYGRVESWEKRQKKYHVVLDSGESVYSPILGSCDVHIIGDNEVVTADQQASIPDSEDIAGNTLHHVISPLI